MIKRVLIVLFLVASMFYGFDLSFATEGDASTIFGAKGTGTSLGLKDGNLLAVVLSAIKWVMGFLYIIAVIYGLYGGWNILTAGGDEKKVGTGKTIIINALIGLVVIFLASTIVTFVFSLLDDNSDATTTSSTYSILGA